MPLMHNLWRLRFKFSFLLYLNGSSTSACGDCISCSCVLCSFDCVEVAFLIVLGEAIERLLKVLLDGFDVGRFIAFRRL